MRRKIMLGLARLDAMRGASEVPLRIHGAEEDLEHSVCGGRKVYCFCKKCDQAVFLIQRGSKRAKQQSSAPNEEVLNVLIVLNKNCPGIARDIDASAIGEHSLNRVIVEERMEWLLYKKIFSFHKPHAHVFW